MSLRRELTRGDLIMLGLGNIIGAGIFVITSKLIFYGGNYTIFAIIIVSILSLITGYVYVKLYEKYKTETVEYDAIRDNMGTLVGKSSLVLIYFYAIVSCVTITVALTKYATHNGYFANSQQWDTIITIVLITIMCFINYRGITVSKIVANTIGGSMLIMLVGIIVIGVITYFGRGSQHTTAHTEFVQSPRNGFIIATILSIFLFNGYDIIVKMSAETKDERDTGTATMTAIGITSIIYICVIGTVIYILGIQQASSTYHPLSLVYEKMNTRSNANTITKLSYIIGGFVMFNTAFISLLGGTRFLYGLVKYKPIVGHISRYQTPDAVILTTFVLAIGLSLTQNEVILAILTNFTVIIILLLLNISYLRIQWKRKITTLSYICKNSLFIIAIIVFIFLFVKIIQLKL
jgi:APA family basic amino acid/polyamine antiporter